VLSSFSLREKGTPFAKQKAGRTNAHQECVHFFAAAKKAPLFAMQKAGRTLDCNQCTLGSSRASSPTRPLGRLGVLLL
jgi:hypothetical protein